LKLKGAINPEELERSYKERIANYTDAKLAGMTDAKKQSSLDKKVKTQEAYKYLSDLLDK
jgi:hypothetical protein